MIPGLIDAVWEVLMHVFALNLLEGGAQTGACKVLVLLLQLLLLSLFPVAHPLTAGESGG